MDLLTIWKCRSWSNYRHLTSLFVCSFINTRVCKKLPLLDLVVVTNISSSKKYYQQQIWRFCQWSSRLISSFSKLHINLFAILRSQSKLVLSCFRHTGIHNMPPTEHTWKISSTICSCNLCFLASSSKTFSHQLAKYRQTLYVCWQICVSEEQLQTLLFCFCLLQNHVRQR